jgi:hypothetical protein
MSIGAGVSLGGNLSLCGMSSCFTPLSDPAAPSDSCTGGGSCTGGNGSSNGSGGSNLPADGSGSCCSPPGNGNGTGTTGSQTATFLSSPASGGNSQCCSNSNGGNGNTMGSQTGTYLSSPSSGSGSTGSQCCSDNSNGDGSSGGNSGATNLSSCPPPSGPVPGCVRPQTRIALFPEGCKAAGEIQVGDVVLTRTPEGALVGEAVSAVRRSLQSCLALTTEDGRRLLCSESHDVMVADPDQAQGRRTRATALTLVDRLLDEDGTSVRLVAMTVEPAGEVIGLLLSGPHHVYLSEGLWSHNREKFPWPATFPSPGS